MTVISTIGIANSELNILYLLDDWIIIFTSVLLTLWYFRGNNKQTNSLVPAYGMTTLFIVTLITGIIEFGTESEIDELLAAPVVAALMIVTYVTYYKVKSETACYQSG